MCLIAYSPKGTMVDRSILAYAYNQNPDGIGIMSVSGIEKFMGKKALKRARRYLESYLVPEQIPYGIHFRWATHGAIQMSNTHPYEAPTGKHWVMHNGVIGLTANEATKDESDTAVFVRKYMTDAASIDDTFYYKALSTKVGWGNKLLIMDDCGQFIICNDDAGVWIDGIWFSNTYSLPNSKVPYQRNWNYSSSYTSRSDADFYRFEPKEKWDSELRKFVPNPAYKAAEDVNREGYAIERVENPDKETTRVVSNGNVYLLPRPKLGGERWDGEDRRSYYEALEAGLTVDDTEYYDAAHTVPPEKAEVDQVMEPHELALRLAEAEGMAAEKDDADIGGDFAPEEDNEEQSRFRQYLKKVAAGIYAS